MAVLITNKAGTGSASVAPTIQKFLSTGTTAGYIFTVTSANATVGATYTNNAHTYTVVNTISSGTILFCSGSSAPSASGTLTKASGTGDATITFSSAQTYSTYTTPTTPSPLYIRVRSVGGGGPGGDAGVNTSSAGTASYFGANLIVCGGGGPGLPGNNGSGSSWAGGAGGSASLGSGPIGIAVSGSDGQGSSVNDGAGSADMAGGSGGASAFGGAGGGGSIGINAAAGNPAKANSGSGGGGASGSNTNGHGGGGGGGSGGFVDAIITSPSASYPYSVGVKGINAGGSPIGGDGADGLIEVTEFYQ